MNVLTNSTIANKCEKMVSNTIQKNEINIFSREARSLKGKSTSRFSQTMISIFCIVFFTFFAILKAYTQSGETGTLMWNIENETLTISGYGEMPNYGADPELQIVWPPAPWFQLEDYFTSVIIENGVTTIGNEAFCGCAHLTSVTIPSSVTVIGHLAFSGCTSLRGITIPKMVTIIKGRTFENCHNLLGIRNMREEPQTSYNNAFDGVNVHAINLYVPSQSVSLYKNSSSTNIWRYFNVIADEPFLVVTFNPQNGNINFSKNIYFNDIIEIPDTPIQPSCIFEGWYKDGIKWNFNTPIWNNTTLIAQWHHIPVISLTDVQENAIVGVPLILTGTVLPYEANQTIDWSLIYGGTTNAVIFEGKLYTSASGTVLIRATIVNGIAIGTDYTRDFEVKVSISGIDELRNNNYELQVFPNSTKDELKIENYELKINNVEYSIYNSSGQLVMKGILHGNSINVKHLVSGMYYLNINGASVKFVKE